MPHAWLLMPLALLLLAACGTVGAPAAEAVALEQIATRYPGAQDVQIVGQRDAPGGAVVLYSLTDAGPSGVPLLIFGQVTLQRAATGWQLLGHASGGVPAAQPVDGQRVELSVSSTGGLGRLSIVYGRRLQPEIVVAEAILADGRVLRDELPDGAFALTVRGGLEAFCALRLLDAAGGELERRALPGEAIGRCT